jgi:hypothetical protein
VLAYCWLSYAPECLSPSLRLCLSLTLSQTLSLSLSPLSLPSLLFLTTPKNLYFLDPTFSLRLTHAHAHTSALYSTPHTWSLLLHMCVYNSHALHREIEIPSRFFGSSSSSLLLCQRTPLSRGQAVDMYESLVSGHSLLTLIRSLLTLIRSLLSDMYASLSQAIRPLAPYLVPPAPLHHNSGTT